MAPPPPGQTTVIRFPSCLAALALAIAALPARADLCDKLPAPEVSVKRLDEPLAFNTQYSYRSLTNIGNALAKPGMAILGLTRGAAVVRFETRISIATDPSGRYECASPRLTVTYGFRPMTVYVAREFPSGSCAYREILDHEMRHVKTYQEHMALIESEISGALQERFAEAGHWRGQAGQTREKMQSELDNRWVPFIKQLLNRVDAKQALIDTPEEYDRVAASCNGEIKRQLRRDR